MPAGQSEVPAMVDDGASRERVASIPNMPELPESPKIRALRKVANPQSLLPNLKNIMDQIDGEDVERRDTN
jgi:hypothetical protein